MKKVFVLPVVLMLLSLVSCTVEEGSFFEKGDPDLEITDKVEPENPEQPEDPNKGEWNGINQRLFDVIDLDHPGLEIVKSYYEDERYYDAAVSLLVYYRSRNIIHPSVDFNITVTETQKSQADQATKEGEYRFLVGSYTESDNPVKYYSLQDKNGGIDWEYIPQELSTEKEYRIQKHRHQWMLPQAKVYAATKDEKYVKAWIEIYSDWLSKYWKDEYMTEWEDSWHGLQTSSRALSQMEIFPYYVQSENFTPEWLSEFLVAFYDHVQYMRKYPYKTETSNIRFAQQQAELTAGVLMPEFVTSAEWLSEGASEVTKALELQFNEDGVQNEMDISYHIGVVSNFLDVYEVAKANGKESLLPSDFLSRLKKATRFVMDVMYPNYSMDNFNDTRSKRMTKSVLQKNLRRYALAFPEDKEMQWMAYDYGQQGGSQPSDNMILYDQTGYYMMRDGWRANSMMLTLKNNHNRSKALTISASSHCQADNQTFGLYRNGRRFLPDAGTYTYTAGSDRNAYRSSGMHNTLTEFKLSGENIKPVDYPYSNVKGELLASGTNGSIEYIVTSNPSYNDLTHRRAIYFVNKKFFVVVDEAYGQYTGGVNVNFLFCDKKADVNIDTYDGANGAFGAHTIFADNNNMLFKTFTEGLEGYVENSGTSYYSDEIGEKTQRMYYRVGYTKAADNAARFITVILPIGAASEFAAQSIEAAFKEDFNENGSSVTVKVNDRSYDLSYTLNK